MTPPGTDSPPTPRLLTGVPTAIALLTMALGIVDIVSALTPERVSRLRNLTEVVAAQEGCRRVAPKTQADRLPKVADRREGDDAVDGQDGRRKPECEVTAGRMTGHDERCWSGEAQGLEKLGEAADGLADVLGGDGPAATLADAAILRRRDDTARIGEGPGEPTSGAPVPLGLPEPPMDQYDEPVGRAVGKVQVDHGIVVIGVAHGGVRQHERHVSGGLGCCS